MPGTTAGRLALPQVTLCAATSVNVAATICALEASLARIEFGACLLFTDASVALDHPAITVVPIAKMESSEHYSQFLVAHLADYVASPHCLVVQWDGHVINADGWDPAFLDHDYIGASWPQFTDGHDVGNGGFSLRSHRLLRACQSLRIGPVHPEDLMIGRINRALLEAQGMRFAPRALADRFSAERAGDPRSSFGYHGIWHMPRVLGAQTFWDTYRTLDDRATIRHDMVTLVKQIIAGPHGLARAFRLVADRMHDAILKRMTAS